MRLMQIQTRSDPLSEGPQSCWLNTSYVGSWDISRSDMLWLIFFSVHPSVRTNIPATHFSLTQSDIYTSSIRRIINAVNALPRKDGNMLKARKFIITRVWSPSDIYYVSALRCQQIALGLANVLGRRSHSRLS